jgi:Tfp pilus assembly protein PilF
VGTEAADFTGRCDPALKRSCIVLIALLACGSPGADPQEQAGSSKPFGLEEVTARMDSAATAFREGDIVRARDIYREVAASDSTLAAAWFGLFMTQRVLGDTSAADSAFHKARRLADRDPARQSR